MYFQDALYLFTNREDKVKIGKNRVFLPFEGLTWECKKYIPDVDDKDDPRNNVSHKK